MAANYSDCIQGTTLTWTDSGGDKAMTLQNLAHGPNARVGAISGSLIHGTYGRPEFLMWRIICGQVTAVDNEIIELLLNWSPDGTKSSSNVGVADAAVSQIKVTGGGLSYVGCLNCEAAIGNSTPMYSDWLPSSVKLDYVAPVINNRGGSNLTNTSAVNKVEMIPYYRRTPIA